jgi:hypothetical protein
MAAPEEAAGAVRQPDDLVVVTTTAICARRHPWAIAGMWAWQTGVALIAAWPAAWLVRAAYGGNPTGDAPLWADGGHALLDALWHEAHGLRETAGASVLALVLGIVAGLVPLAALMVSMTYATRERRPPGLVPSVAAGLRAFPAFAVLLLLFGLIEGLTLGAGAGAASLAEHAAHAALGEARAGQIQALVAALFLLAASAISVAHDLGRATVVRFKVTGWRAFLLGAGAFRAAPVRLWWSWAWRAGAAAAPVVAAGAAASSVGARGGLSLLLLALLHQAVVLARVALRASWLGCALRAVDVGIVPTPP